MRFFRHTLRLPPIWAHFHDIRKNPVIPLRTILQVLFLLPFFGNRSLLSVDQEGRSPWMRRLFQMHSRRDKEQIVVSDSTLQRVLRWIEANRILRILPHLERRLRPLGLLHRRLSSTGKPYRLAQVDGSGKRKVSHCVSHPLGRGKPALTHSPDGKERKGVTRSPCPHPSCRETAQGALPRAMVTGWAILQCVYLLLNL